MQYLRIGEVDFPQLGLGLYSMHGDLLKNAVDAALELGYSWLDTAYRYENEKALGFAVCGREKVFLSEQDICKESPERYTVSFGRAKH